jgi:ribosomal protein L7/L12
MPAMPELTDDQINAIASEIATDRKINAIKLYREFTGVGLAEAKAAIDQFRAAEHTPGGADTGAEQTGLSDQQFQSILAELRGQRMIPAIKLYREYTGVGLAEAKSAVEQIAAENGVRPSSKSGCGAAALLMLLLPAVLYWIVS